MQLMYVVSMKCHKFYLIADILIWLFLDLGLSNGDELLIADETCVRPISLRIRYQGD